MPADTSVDALADLIGGRRVVALTGAGCSTESGIPDYRGPETRRRARNPMQWRAFRDDPRARRRYWARSLVGWERIRNAKPNAGHRALADLERAGVVHGVITQNVDRLHHAAGSQRVVELHGAVAEVRCLECDAIGSRAELQDRLRALNPGWSALAATAAPDGDADLDGDLIRDFRTVDCSECGGALKPNVVFFGESVPKPIVDAAWRLFDESDALLVLGSSLAVFSGYRFVKKAAERGLAIAIVNVGQTRGDPHATLRLEGRTGAVLPALARRIGASPSTSPDSPVGHTGGP